MLAVAAGVVAAGCSGHTTGATAITQQSNGSFSAQLNAVGSCDTNCTAFMRWRVVGTSTWTESASFTVGQVTNAPWSRTATGLFPRAPYEYQACGKESAQSQFTCVGPDGTPATTQRFLASRKFAYVPHGSSISQFAASESGLLTPLSPPTVAATGDGLWGIAVSPNGNSVYAVSEDSGKVEQYNVGSGGGLTPKSAGAVTAGLFPSYVAVRPDSRSVYVSLDVEGTGVPSPLAQFDAAADGTLTAKSPAAVGSGERPIGPAVSPDGRSLYVASEQGVVQYDIDSAGKLTLKNPGTVGTTDGFDVAVSPDGRSVYVAAHRFGISGFVEQYDVTSGGRLVAKSPQSVPTGDPGAWGIAITPDGTSVYVANEGPGTGPPGSVSQFTVGTGGKLTAKSPATVSAGESPNDIAVSADGKSVYVTDRSGGVVWQFSVGSGGKLSPKSPATVAGGAVFGVAVTP